MTLWPRKREAVFLVVLQRGNRWLLLGAYKEKRHAQKRVRRLGLTRSHDVERFIREVSVNEGVFMEL